MKKILLLLFALISIGAMAQDSKMERIARAAEAQLGKYNTYDARELPVDSVGIVQGDGCCIDVVIRALWDGIGYSLMQGMWNYCSDYPWLGKIDMRKTIIHRRCRYVCKFYEQTWVDLDPVANPYNQDIARGSIIIWKAPAYWHCGIAVSETEFIHNIGNGVEKEKFEDYDFFKVALVINYEWTK